jgi:hypothetical protein
VHERQRTTSNYIEGDENKGITLADFSFLICGEGISLEDKEKLHLIWYPEHSTLVLVVLL